MTNPKDLLPSYEAREVAGEWHINTRIPHPSGNGGATIETILEVNDNCGVAPLPAETAFRVAALLNIAREVSTDELHRKGAQFKFITHAEHMAAQSGCQAVGPSPEQLTYNAAMNAALDTLRSRIFPDANVTLDTHALIMNAVSYIDSLTIARDSAQCTVNRYESGESTDRENDLIDTCEALRRSLRIIGNAFDIKLAGSSDMFAEKIVEAHNAMKVDLSTRVEAATETVEAIIEAMHTCGEHSQDDNPIHSVMALLSKVEAARNDAVRDTQRVERRDREISELKKSLASRNDDLIKITTALGVTGPVQFFDLHAHITAKLADRERLLEATKASLDKANETIEAFHAHDDRCCNTIDHLSEQLTAAQVKLNDSQRRCAVLQSRVDDCEHVISRANPNNGTTGTLASALAAMPAPERVGETVEELTRQLRQSNLENCQLRDTLSKRVQNLQDISRALEIGRKVPFHELPFVAEKRNALINQIQEKHKGFQEFQTSVKVLHDNICDLIGRERSEVKPGDLPLVVLFDLLKAEFNKPRDQLLSLLESHEIEPGDTHWETCISELHHLLRGLTVAQHKHDEQLRTLLADRNADRAIIGAIDDLCGDKQHRPVAPVMAAISALVQSHIRALCAKEKRNA